MKERYAHLAARDAADFPAPLPPRLRLLFQMQENAFSMARDAFNDTRPALEDRLRIVCIIADPEYRRDPEKGAATVRKIAAANRSNLAYGQHLEPYANALERYWMDRELAPNDAAHDAMEAERMKGGSASAGTAGAATEEPQHAPATTHAARHEDRF